MGIKKRKASTNIQSTASPINSIVDEAAFPKMLNSVKPLGICFILWLLLFLPSISATLFAPSGPCNLLVLNRGFGGLGLCPTTLCCNLPLLNLASLQGKFFWWQFGHFEFLRWFSGWKHSFGAPTWCRSSRCCCCSTRTGRNCPNQLVPTIVRTTNFGGTHLPNHSAANSSSCTNCIWQRGKLDGI